MEKENSFLNFKNLFAAFTNNKQTEDQKRISTKVSQLIENKMLDIVFEYMDSGYKLNPVQEQGFYTIFNKMHSSNKMELMDSWIKKGFNMPDKLVESQLPLFLHYRSMFKNLEERPETGEYRGKSFFNFYEKQISTINTDSLYQDWKNNVNYYSSTFKSSLKRKKYITYNKESSDQLWEKLVTPIKGYGEMILKNQSVDEILVFLNKIETIRDFVTNFRDYRNGNLDRGLNEVANALRAMPEKLFKEEIENDKKQISIIFGEDHINQLIAQENIKMVSKNNIKDLPKEAKEVLENIKNDYLQLNKRINGLSEEEKFTVNNLWNKRIPEIINKYLLAAPEFRSTMKNNNGQSIEDLMIDSLKNIHITLNEINVHHSQNVLHDMSAINRYTKAIK